MLRAFLLPALLGCLLSPSAVRSARSAAASSQPTGIPPRAAVRTRCQAPPAPVPGATLNVSPHGDDTWPGTKTKPFATLERCRDEIRGLKSKGPLPTGGILILVHGGEYRSPGHSSCRGRFRHRIRSDLLRRRPGGKAGVSRRQTHHGLAAFVRCGRLPAAAPGIREKAWITDLNACGIENVLPLKLGGFGSGDGFSTRPAHELFFNGRAMPLARGPNEGFLRIKEVEFPDGTVNYGRRAARPVAFFTRAMFRGNG